MTYGQALDRATKRLGQSTATPRLDAEVLLAFVVSQTRAAIMTHPERRLSPAQQQRYTRFIDQRKRFTPIPYLTGTSEFFGHSCIVTPAVLVPRPFTELIVEWALKNYQPGDVIVDCGTGSGCIGLSLALAQPKARIIATDVSPAALRIARRNIHRHHLTSRVVLRRGSLLSPIHLRDQVTTIIANLPYVTTKQLAEPSISREPRLALHGGSRGLAVMTQLIAELPRLLTVRTVILECDPAQVSTLRQHFRRDWPGVSFSTISDGHRVRGLIAQRKPRATSAGRKIVRTSR